jgi:hypothetical protein
MIRFYSNIKDFINTGIIGVCGSMSCRQDPTSTLSALKIAGLARGAGILLSTLFKLNGNRPLIVKPALIFLSINALSLAGLYRVVKYSLLIVFIPSYLSRLT